MRPAGVALSVTLSLAFAQLSCHQAILTAPTGSTLTLIANPEFIRANGGVSVVSALLIEPAGTVVPDGTVVQFFANLGEIESQGKTNDGVARVNFVAGPLSGVATVTAVSGLAEGESTVEVRIGSDRPTDLILIADPPVLRAPGSVRVVANVFDEFGNPVPNVPVIFAVSLTPGPAPTPTPVPTPTPTPTPSPTPSPTPTPTPFASLTVSQAAEFTERMQSGGAPVFTNNNGQAIDELISDQARDAPPKIVFVRATGPGVQDEVSVAIE